MEARPKVTPGTTSLDNEVWRRIASVAFDVTGVLRPRFPGCPVEDIVDLALHEVASGEDVSFLEVSLVPAGGTAHHARYSFNDNHFRRLVTATANQLLLSHAA